MKLSDYVARFLAEQGIRHVFTIAGGSSVHLIDSIARTPGIEFICPQHEQAGAMAADGYSRATGNLGAALATSGPGATNMITGVCCAYFDSVPVIYITGQVATYRLRGDSGVRQIGFQETQSVEMYRPITKYAVLIEDPRRIRYELEKASHIARSGRPGPVLVDIPDDLQRSEINPEELESFVPPPRVNNGRELEAQADACIRLLEKAERPVVILGWGVRLAGAEAEARALVERLGFPLVPTWAMMDLLPYDHPLLVGAFGTHGTRYGNFAVQNSDLVLSIGSRLDTHEAGSPPTSFAREARKILVDVDGAELDKFARFGARLDLAIKADAKDFLRALLAALEGIRPRDVSPWMRTIARWKETYPICCKEYYLESSVNPYVFVKELARASARGDTIVLDTGCALAWMMQAFEFKEDQRAFHDFNNTAMGYGLPAAIGASIALGGKPVICVTGDGALQMNIQELATVLRHNLPIKIFVLNNHGYSMIQQTQDQWLGSRYVGSNVAGGLAFPDFGRVAAAYGYKVVTICRNAELARAIHTVLDSDGAVFCNVEIRPEHRVIPQVKYPRPIEDAEPLLDRDEFLRNMIVKPSEASLR